MNNFILPISLLLIGASVIYIIIKGARQGAENITKKKNKGMPQVK